jgi:hypothetical protein
MANGVLVEIFEAVDNLSEEGHGFLWREGATGHKVVKQFAVGCVFEDDVEMTGALADIDELDEVRVIHQAHKTDFPLKLKVELGFLDNFDCDRMSRHPVLSVFDFTGDP